MAHDLTKKWRSEDIKTEENSDFSSLLLSKRTNEGLSKCGFIRPSPIQLQAIPLGRCGLDLIVQAKSGTGKTCVFTVIALEGLLVDSTATQVLVLAPTREIAFQIKDVINSIGSSFPNLKCGIFIGGLSISDDKNNLKNCQIAIGTPGRIKHLIELGALKTNSIRLFVLDEADKLLDESFQEGINWIYKQLPTNKQMLALSATYPEALANLLKDYMRNPFYIRLNADQPVLIGIKQYYKTTKFHQMQHVAFQSKVDELLSLLKEIHFSQCIVFSNSQVRAESLSETLIKNGWPATYISGAQDQTRRLSAMAQLKTFQCRILVSTDLTSRGIDAENVNLIINIDVPKDLETYLHRIGRAGRFGSQGLAVTLVTKGKDLNSFVEIARQGRLEIIELPKKSPEDLWTYNPDAPRVISNEIKPKEVEKLIMKQQLRDKIRSLPKPTNVSFDESDFDWLSNEEEPEFPSFTELTKDFDSFVANYQEPHVGVEIVEELLDNDDEDVDFNEEIETANRKKEEKIMNFLNESKTNFWMALAKNCQEELEDGITEMAKESSEMILNSENSANIEIDTTLKFLEGATSSMIEDNLKLGKDSLKKNQDSTSKFPIDLSRKIDDMTSKLLTSSLNGDSTLKSLKFTEIPSKMGEDLTLKLAKDSALKLANDLSSKMEKDSRVEDQVTTPVKKEKIEPVPSLLANMSESKRRMILFYQSIQAQNAISPNGESSRNQPTSSNNIERNEATLTETSLNLDESSLNLDESSTDENSSSSSEDETLSENSQDMNERDMQCKASNLDEYDGSDSSSDSESDEKDLRSKFLGSQEMIKLTTIPSATIHELSSSESDNDSYESLSEIRQETIDKPSFRLSGSNITSNSVDNEEAKVSMNETLRKEMNENASDSILSEEGSDLDSLSSSLDESPNFTIPLGPNFPTYQYLYPNMNSSIQRAATNYSNYMSHMMSWYKNHQPKPK